MKLMKATLFSFLFMGITLAFLSCEPDAEQDRVTDFEKKDIILSGAQHAPATTSTATGKMSVFYSRNTKILNYTISWTGLADSVQFMHIHGPAPVGYNAGIIQNIVAPSGGIFPQRTSGRFTFARTGSLSGTLLADEVVVRERDILNGMLYVNIRTSAFPAGEIRGQIVFQ
ncbi:MAG: CHRD domain-containing protein [Chitinophagaceae bacterium]|nr:CHRD domain-containing protein [Chitinophagaceae bacterium]